MIILQFYIAPSVAAFSCIVLATSLSCFDIYIYVMRQQLPSNDSKMYRVNTGKGNQLLTGARLFVGGSASWSALR